MIELLLEAEAALSAGRLDRAETLYQQVAGADPHNSIAMVGLARVALERSDEVGAVTFARRALAIDPENNAAQRMVRRLEEDLRNRGVSVQPNVAAATTPGPATGAASSSSAEAAEPPAAAADAANPVAPEPSAAEPNRRSYLDRLLRRGPGGR